MQHDICIEGPTLRLRPVRLSDAPFIVAIRRDAERSRYLHRVSQRVEDQEAWILEYLERDGDYTFVVEEETGDAAGTIALYDVDRLRRWAEWGRWILRPGVLCAVESALLLYRVAFDCLGLEEVICRTVEENAHVVSFHSSCGLVERQTLRGHFRIDGTTYDAVEHVLTRASWPDVERKLISRVARLHGLVELVA